MADKLEYDVLFRDRGTDVLGKAAAGLRDVDAAAGKAARTSADLADGQLKVGLAMNNVRKAETTLTAAQERLAKVTADASATDEQKAKAAIALEAAELKHARTLLGVEKASEAAARASRGIGSAAQDAESKATKAFTGIGGSAGKLGKSVGEALKGLAKGAAVGALAAGVAVGALVAQGINQTLDMTASRAKLRAQLDLSARDAEKVGKLAGGLYAQNYGDNLGQVNDAIRAVISSGAVLRGTSSKDLGDVAAAALSVAKVFDQDVGGTARSAGQLIRTGLAKNGVDALNLITRAYQTGGDNAGDLLDTLDEYGTQMRKLGIDGPHALGLINQGLKAGARDGDTVADALKEISIRAIDGSKTTVAGFKLLGLNADQMAARFGKGGKSASSALELVLDKLRGMKDPLKQGTAATDLFGTKAEDLGAALFALDPATASVDKVAGAAGRLNDALSADPGAKIETIKRALEAKIQGGIIAGFEWLQEHRADVVGGLIDIGKGASVVAQAMLGLASAGGYAAAAALGVAAASVVLANPGLAKELWHSADAALGMAGKSAELANTLETKTNPTLDTLEKKLLAASSSGHEAAGGSAAAARAANSIPVGKNTKITAEDLLSAKAARIQGSLKAISPHYQVIIDVTSRGIGTVQRNIDSITGHAVSIQVGRIGVGPGANAAGTPSWRGGPTWVGEEGRELIDLPAGTRIWSNPESERMATDAASFAPAPAAAYAAPVAPASGGVRDIHVHLPAGTVVGDRKAVIDWMRQGIRDGLRAEGKAAAAQAI